MPAALSRANRRRSTGGLASADGRRSNRGHRLLTGRAAPGSAVRADPEVVIHTRSCHVVPGESPSVRNGNWPSSFGLKVPTSSAVDLGSDAMSRSTARPTGSLDSPENSLRLALPQTPIAASIRASKPDRDDQLEFLDDRTARAGRSSFSYRDFTGDRHGRRRGGATAGNTTAEMVRGDRCQPPFPDPCRLATRPNVSHLSPPSFAALVGLAGRRSRRLPPRPARHRPRRRHWSSPDRCWGRSARRSARHSQSRSTRNFHSRMSRSSGSPGLACSRSSRDCVAVNSSTAWSEMFAGTK